MKRVRVIPVLTVQDRKLVKTVRYKDANYIGDPINAIKIFNEKEVDELVLLDIGVAKNGGEPCYQLVEEMAAEAFMPFAYGGGVKSFDQVEKLFQLGVEKVVLNTALVTNIDLVKKISERYGNQSIVASVDVKKNWLGKYGCYIKGGTQKVEGSWMDYFQKIAHLPIGEVLLSSIDKDGMKTGYDLSFLLKIKSMIDVPLVMNSGANSLSDMHSAIIEGADAVAASSFFIYKGSNNGILINYPNQRNLKEELFEKI